MAIWYAQKKKHNQQTIFLIADKNSHSYFTEDGMERKMCSHYNIALLQNVYEVLNKHS